MINSTLRLAGSRQITWAIACAVSFPAIAQTSPQVKVSVVTTAPAAKAIEFLDNLTSAQLIAQQQHKLVVAQFGATWCGWCKRMDSQTFTDKKVIAQANKFIWVHVDIDDHPDQASTYHVRGVPHTVIMDHTGEMLVEHVGYMPAGDFVNLLDSSATAQAQREISGDAGPPDMGAAITKLVEGLAKPERGGREQVLKAIASVGEEAWPVLEKLMADDRIAIRAAAAAALANSTNSKLVFDPFADAEKRNEQLAVWHDWIEQHAKAHDQA